VLKCEVSQIINKTWSWAEVLQSRSGPLWSCSCSTSVRRAAASPQHNDTSKECQRRSIEHACPPGWAVLPHDSCICLCNALCNLLLVKRPLHAHARQRPAVAADACASTGWSHAIYGGKEVSRNAAYYNQRVP